VHFFTVTFDPKNINETKKQQFLTWLEKDLETANRDVFREQRPWIIGLSVYPLECSEEETCSSYNTDYKEVWDMLKKYNVDMFISGNLQTYERTYPVHDNSKQGWEDYFNYDRNYYIKNARGTVYVVEGRGGDSEAGVDY
jgi:hypothetical protein